MHVLGAKKRADVDLVLVLTVFERLRNFDRRANFCLDVLVNFQAFKNFSFVAKIEKLMFADASTRSVLLISHWFYK